MTSNLQTRYIVIALVLALAGLCIGLNWPINLGIDLKGGSILTYRIERLDYANPAEVTPEQQQRDLTDTLTVISQRINKEGVKDISVQQEGTDRIVITLPDFTPGQTAEIRGRMTQMGALELPIGAESGDKAYGVAFNPQTFEKERVEQKAAYNPPRGFRWCPRRPEPVKGESKSDYEKRLEDYLVARVERPWELQGMWLYFPEQYWDAALFPANPGPGITGRNIFAARRSVDQEGGNAVTFEVNEDKQAFLTAYSSDYKGRLMAMVLNGEVWSSATIRSELSSNVQISRGNGGYSKEEQNWLLNCLQAGSLKLKPVLESQEQIGATLGAKAIERGRLAFIVGGIAVIAFMIVYYSFAGILAVIALALNFVMVFAILMLLEASLTLPGLAGLVLTIGMAVDANILIFERIREEVAKGKKLIHAAKNGFDRAFVTIFDANLTTFIVALFLVWYGEGPIKGFGYTLMAGIICSMFAALYVVRTLLGTALAQNWVSELKMRRIMENAHFDFVGKIKPAAIGSSLLVLLGLALFLGTGKEKYALDFNGGTAVRMVFSEPIGDSDVKAIIAGIKDESGKTKYNSIDAHMLDPDGRKASEMDIRLDYIAKAKSGDGTTDDGADPYEEIRRELATAFGDKLVPEPVSAETYDATTKSWSAELHFAAPVTDPQALRTIAEQLNLSGLSVDPTNADKSAWLVKATMSPEVKDQAARHFIDSIEKAPGMALSNPFPKVRFIGPQVVADLRESAFQSMFLSLVFILAYIWFRFKELKYGVAASVALVHDVLISLGMVILFNMTGLVTVPISLDVIAGFLTIIGYSLNDTIIVFDRIRENLGSTRGSYAEIINRSINQTLSRTIFTSMTTFFVVLAIFAANVGLETPLQGLSFTLLCGIVVGTYSSIFVASPILIWFHNREVAKNQSGSPQAKQTAPVA
ncbi:MAG: protein translocase subunit SecD [Planctomycetes bacterium]|nr:protein translocase subunit SecD [Planctomycetota bacterium]